MKERDEYAIDALRFRTTLLEQRAMRLPGGLYHLNQIQLAYNSNRIEGSQLSADQTRYLYETQTVDGPARVEDVVETTNHFRLFDLMLDAVGTPLTAARTCQYHGVLKSGTSDAAADWFWTRSCCGRWPPRAGNQRCANAPPARLPDRTQVSTWQPAGWSVRPAVQPARPGRRRPRSSGGGRCWTGTGPPQTQVSWDSAAKPAD
jgi:hypothetical protein